MLVLCCCCASVPCPLALLRDAFSLPDLPFLAFCFCHLPLLFCPWFFALCCSCSSLSGSSAPLLVLCCSCFPALPVWLLLLLLFFVSWVLLLFNRNWNVGKFGFYSREGVLWSTTTEDSRDHEPAKEPIFGTTAQVALSVAPWGAERRTVY